MGLKGTRLGSEIGLGLQDAVIRTRFYIAELVTGRVHPWVVLGWVGSKTMGHLTQSVSIDDLYKMNISYQCIEK